jgi:tRNA-specific 2-thiouridylase
MRRTSSFIFRPEAKLLRRVYIEMTSAKPRVAIAMSGGVDSSVAAALLVEQGYDVFAVMLRLWSTKPEFPNRCCTPKDAASAQSVASLLEIPFHKLDTKSLFKENVVDAFTNAYARGITPNPCLICNRKMRWGYLLNKVREMGATHLATGHYARIERFDGQFRLLRGKDRSKDQSYVLSVLRQSDLARTIFPLGELRKREVRQHARRLNLPVAEKPDSQDLCFVPGCDYREFLRQQDIPMPPSGPIVDLKGTQIGTHDGLSNYTIGQRRGIGLSTPQALYVIEKQIASNTLVVGSRSSLGRKAFTTEPVNWIAGRPPDPSIPLVVRIRYKASETPATIKIRDDMSVEVHLKNSVPDVTPGQSAVFYSGEICFGGGVIRE